MEMRRLPDLIVATADQRVLLVTLNRPDRLNAMTVTMFDELEQAARALSDDDEVRWSSSPGPARASAPATTSTTPNGSGTVAVGMFDQQNRAARALAAIRRFGSGDRRGQRRGCRRWLLAQPDGRHPTGIAWAKFNGAFVKIGPGSAGDLGVSWCCRG